MNIQTYAGNQVHFHDVVKAVGRFIVKASVERRGLSFEDIPGDHKVWRPVPLSFSTDTWRPHCYCARIFLFLLDREKVGKSQKLSVQREDGVHTGALLWRHRHHELLPYLCVSTAVG